MKVNFEIIDYDLISEDNFSYSVNAAYNSGIIIELEENFTDKEIIRELKRIGYLKNNLRYNNFSICGEFDYTLYIEHSTSKCFTPVLELRNCNNG
jgi:hypothetical protein